MEPDSEISQLPKKDELQRLLISKADSDYYGRLLEHVADCLATRNPKYAEGISPAILVGYDSPSSRSNYLQMQDILANLRLRERAELGRKFHQVIDRMRSKNDGFVYNAPYLDARPQLGLCVCRFTTCVLISPVLLL
jgi:hypothetical protein